MARLTKQIDQWHPVPNDTDKAEIRIKHLKAGKIAEIEAESTPMKARPNGDGDITADDMSITVNLYQRQVSIVQAAVLDWKNFFDAKGNQIPCNNATKTMMLREFAWFGPLVVSLVEKIRAEVQAEDVPAQEN